MEEAVPWGCMCLSTNHTPLTTQDVPGAAATHSTHHCCPRTHPDPDTEPPRTHLCIGETRAHQAPICAKGPRLPEAPDAINTKFISFVYILLYLLISFVCVVCRFMCGGQLITWSQFSPTKWLLDVELRSPGLAPSTFTC